MKLSNAKASGVADWSVASSATIARQSSDDTTSVVLKWREAKWDFPNLWDRRARRDTVREWRYSSREHPHLGRRSM